MIDTNTPAHATHTAPTTNPAMPAAAMPKPLSLASAITAHMRRLDESVSALDTDVDGMHLATSTRLATILTLLVGVFVFVGVTMLLNAAMLVLLGVLVGRR